MYSYDGLIFQIHVSEIIQELKKSICRKSPDINSNSGVMWMTQSTYDDKSALVQICKG